MYSRADNEKPSQLEIGTHDIMQVDFKRCRGILLYNICLISISNSVSDGATNKSVLNIERV